LRCQAEFFGAIRIARESLKKKRLKEYAQHVANDKYLPGMDAEPDAVPGELRRPRKQAGTAVLV
jgi:hypothetical protein